MCTYTNAYNELRARLEDSCQQVANFTLRIRPSVFKVIDNILRYYAQLKRLARPGSLQETVENHLSCKQRMTRADPGGTEEQKSCRSSKQASASGTSNRISEEAYSMILSTRDLHPGLMMSSLQAA